MSIIPTLPVYQEELKREVANFHNCEPEQMDLPHSAWEVLRDDYLRFMDRVEKAE